MPPSDEILAQRVVNSSEYKAPTGPIDTRDINTPDDHVSRDPSMNRLTGKHPFNAEPPVKMLLDSGFITPNNLHIVRNHGPVPKNKWDTHTITIGGLVNNPVTISMNDLVQLPIQTLPVTLCCAGNRRKEQNMIKPTIGFSWGPAGVGTAYWTGVYIRDVIDKFAGGLKPEALHICIEGNDDTAKGPYGTSITAQRAMSIEYDVLIAYKMNGEPLPYDHGYPVRCIVPGCIGGRSVKWLTKIEATLEPSKNPFQDADNKVFPPVVQSSEQATEEKWWSRPDYSIYDLNVNSVIASPLHGSTIELNNLNKVVEIKGYAYGGSNRKITRCEITLDDGKTWKMANVHYNMKEEADQYATENYGIVPIKGTNYYKQTRFWTWVFWTLELPVYELLGVHEICLRCWNDANNSQPRDLTWSLMGMLNNCWYRVKVHIIKEPTLKLMFQHPTTIPGDVTLKDVDIFGWMEEKQEKEQVKPKTTIHSSKSQLKVYTEEEVAKHVTEEDCWIIYENKVYDCTPFLKEHPGGASSIVLVSGTDTTEEFDAIHSSKARDMLEKYLIGKVKLNNTEAVAEITPPRSPTPSTTDPVRPVTKKINITNPIEISNQLYFDPRSWKKLTLHKKEFLSTTLRKFTFVLPQGCCQKLQIPVGAHLYMKIKENINDHSPKPKMAIKAYTPSFIAEKSIELVIKIYYPFNSIPGGRMTTALDQVRIGESVEFKGPTVEIEYNGNGKFTFYEKKKTQTATHIGMIAGGTGITPMWQIIKAIEKDTNPPCVSLIYCARSRNDIIFFDELTSLQERFGTAQFSVRYLLSESPEQQNFEYGRGRLNRTEINNFLFKDIEETDSRLMFLCGPESMIESCCKPLLTQAFGEDFVKENVYTF